MHAGHLFPFLRARKKWTKDKPFLEAQVNPSPDDPVVTNENLQSERSRGILLDSCFIEVCQDKHGLTTSPQAFRVSVVLAATLYSLPRRVGKTLFLTGFTLPRRFWRGTQISKDAQGLAFALHGKSIAPCYARINQRPRNF